MNFAKSGFRLLLGIALIVVGWLNKAKKWGRPVMYAGGVVELLAAFLLVTNADSEGFYV